MHPEIAAQLDNRFYLNAPFFYVRGVLYLIVWLGLGIFGAARAAASRLRVDPLSARAARV